jgi:alkanesulfonate monooxygenase SsuD/methylene tetrahydromethanopterin reductase-like flavin-dependent oxidoreductase (luciferase family)
LLEPTPSSPAGPPIWVASWGSRAGLRRVARLGDGWLASGYNTTPAIFRASLAHLYEEFEGARASREAFPNGIATMWLYVSEVRRDAERMLGDVLAAMLNRPIEALRDLALPIGSAEHCAERISAYQNPGAQRIFVWPLADELKPARALPSRRGTSRLCGLIAPRRTTAVASAALALLPQGGSARAAIRWP